jgi:hypothetical protein
MKNGVVVIWKTAHREPPRMPRAPKRGRIYNAKAKRGLEARGA